MSGGESRPMMWATIGQQATIFTFLWFGMEEGRVGMCRVTTDGMKLVNVGSRVTMGPTEGRRHSATQRNNRRRQPTPTTAEDRIGR